MKLTARSANPAETRLKKLAEKIEALAAKDELVEKRAHQIAATRAAAALELYSICAEFAAGLNRILSHADVLIDPPANAIEHLSLHLRALIQINVRGRILQIEFEPTGELISTEEFRVPYTLSGAVRAFNQELLEKDLIEEQLLFYTIEKHRQMWRFFDPRTYRTGPFDQEYLVCLMEQLI